MQNHYRIHPNPKLEGLLTHHHGKTNKIKEREYRSLELQRKINNNLQSFQIFQSNSKNNQAPKKELDLNQTKKKLQTTPLLNDLISYL